METIVKKIKESNFFLKSLFVIVLSVIISLVFTNYRIIFYASNEKFNLYNENVEYSGFDHIDGKFVSTSDEAIIKINLDKKYIEKLNFNYSSDDKIVYSANIIYYDSYSSEATSKQDLTLTNEIDISSIPIRRYVKSIELKFTGNNYSIYDMHIDNQINFNYVSFILIYLLINCVFFLLFHNGKLEKIENKFLLVGLSLGLMLLFGFNRITGVSWDEQIHFHNVHKLSYGDEVNWSESTRNLYELKIPFYKYDTIEERIAVNNYLNEKHKDIVKTEENNYKLAYNNSIYLPMSIVYKINDLLGVPLIINLYLTCFTNLLIYILLIYYAIKIIPIYKRLLFCIGIIPTELFMATRFSYDPLIVGLITLSLAIFIYEYVNKNKKLSFKNCLICILAMILGSFPKAIYIPLLLLLILLPNTKFDNNKKALKFKIGIILIVGAIMATFVLPTVTNPSSGGDIRGGNTSMSGQLSIIKNNPLGFAEVFENNAGDLFIERLIGVGTMFSFAYNGNIKKTNLIWIFTIVFIYLFFTDRYNLKNKFDWKYRLWNLLIIFGIISMIWLSMYLSFTPVGSLTINGVQGRYFIPILLPLLICLNVSGIKNDIKVEKYDLYVSLILFITVYFMIYYNTIAMWF